MPRQHYDQNFEQPYHPSTNRQFDQSFDRQREQNSTNRNQQYEQQQFDQPPVTRPNDIHFERQRMDPQSFDSQQISQQPYKPPTNRQNFERPFDQSIDRQAFEQPIDKRSQYNSNPHPQNIPSQFIQHPVMNHPQYSQQFDNQQQQFYHRSPPFPQNQFIPHDPSLESQSLSARDRPSPGYASHPTFGQTQMINQPTEIQKQFSYPQPNQPQLNQPQPPYGSQRDAHPQFNQPQFNQQPPLDQTPLDRSVDQPQYAKQQPYPRPETTQPPYGSQRDAHPQFNQPATHPNYPQQPTNIPLFVTEQYPAPVGYQIRGEMNYQPAPQTQQPPGQQHNYK